MDTVTGKLLIAIPDLPDSNFSRSVVFVIEHTQDGAMGVVLNRPTGVKLEELWRNLDSDIDVNRDDVVHVGGPVKGPVLALHNDYKFTEPEVIDGVAMTMSSDRLNQLVASTEIKFKAFSGYSGWGPGQLDAEIAGGGWLVMPAEPADVFDSTDTLWQKVCERFGRDIMLSHLPGNQKPGDPNLN